MRNPQVGDAVRIERDEARYPSKGTWPQFRGRVGTVVEVNTDRKHAHLTEYGVVFAKARTDGRGGQYSIVTWFKLHEMHALTPEVNAEPQLDVFAIGDIGEAVQ